MEESKTKRSSKSTLQKVVEEQLNKTPSKYEYNKVLFSWEANDRPVYYYGGWQKFSLTGLMVFLGLYFFWVGQPILTLLAGAVFFILFVLISLPPQKVIHQIEKVGIRSVDRLYSWDEMLSFWVAEKDGSMIVYIDTRLNFPARLIFMVESFRDAIQIVKLVSEKITYKVLTDRQGKMEQFLEGKYVDPIVFFNADFIEKKIIEAAEQNK